MIEPPAALGAGARSGGVAPHLEVRCARVCVLRRGHRWVEPRLVAALGAAAAEGCVCGGVGRCLGVFLPAAVAKGLFGAGPCPGEGGGEGWSHT